MYFLLRRDLAHDFAMASSIPSPKPPVIVVGIAGSCGNGKTSLSQSLQDDLGHSNCTFLQQSCYSKKTVLQPHPSLPASYRNLLQRHHPDNLDTKLLVEHLKSLKCGEAVEVPVHDSTYTKNYGKMSKTKKNKKRKMKQWLEGTRIVLVEGLWLLVDPELREVLDIKVYVDFSTPTKQRAAAQLLRKCTSSVNPMMDPFIGLNKEMADIVVPCGEGKDMEVARKMIGGYLMSSLSEVKTAA